jgi:hypothetical protein
MTTKDTLAAASALTPPPFLPPGTSLTPAPPTRRADAEPPAATGIPLSQLLDTVRNTVRDTIRKDADTREDREVAVERRLDALEKDSMPFLTSSLGEG